MESLVSGFVLWLLPTSLILTILSQDKLYWFYREQTPVFFDADRFNLKLNTLLFCH